MTNVDPALFQELVNQLTPFMTTETERQAKLRLALPTAAYRQINFHGPADVFTANMVNTLLQYGESAPDKQAIIAVLDVIHDQVGVNKQRDIDQLRLRLLAHFQAAEWVACSRCGVSNRVTAKFCRSCGKELAAPFPLPRPFLTRWSIVGGGVAVLVIVIWLGWVIQGRVNLPSTAIAPTATVGAINTGEPPVTSGAETATPAPQQADVTSLVGIWRISRQTNVGSSLINWDITRDGDQLAIAEFNQMVDGVPLPGDSRQPLQLTNFVFDGQRLAFTATGSVVGVTETFDLMLIGTDRMEGTYTATDTTLSDTGMVQGSAGILRSEGRAILVRQPQ